jgi:hypothetical protein
MRADAKSLKRVARPEGIEPPTLCLEGRRSIRLSYGRVWAHFSGECPWGARKFPSA